MRSFTFAKRSGRKGWSVIVILAIIQLLIGCSLLVGVILFHFVDFATPLFLLKIIGLTILFSSIASILRLIWIKPIDARGGDKDGE